MYAYPPTALMQQVLHKLVHSLQCQMLPVAPLQHYQPWVPMLLRWLVDFPRKKPPLLWLLGQPQSGVFPSHPKQVHLLVWSLSSVAGESNSFLKWFPIVSLVQNRLIHKSLFSSSFEFLFSSSKLSSSTIKSYRSATSPGFRRDAGILVQTQSCRHYC